MSTNDSQTGAEKIPHSVVEEACVCSHREKDQISACLQGLLDYPSIYLLKAFLQLSHSCALIYSEIKLSNLLKIKFIVGY